MITTLTGKQLRELVEFVCPDGDEDQLETEISIQYIEKEPYKQMIKNEENIEFKPGYYAWLSDYPEEGSIYLG